MTDNTVFKIKSYRALRKRWAALSDKEKVGCKRRMWTHRWKLAALGALVVFAAGLDYVTHIQEAPITKRKRYIAFTDKQFQKILQFEYEMVSINMLLISI